MPRRSSSTTRQVSKQGGYWALLYFKYKLRIYLFDVWANDNRIKQGVPFDDVRDGLRDAHAASAFQSQLQSANNWKDRPDLRFLATAVLALVYAKESDGIIRYALSCSWTVAQFVKRHPVARRYLELPDETKHQLTQAAFLQAKDDGTHPVPILSGLALPGFKHELREQFPDVAQILQKFEKQVWDSIIDKVVFLDASDFDDSFVQLAWLIAGSPAGRVRGTKANGFVLVHYDAKQSGELSTSPAIRTPSLRKDNLAVRIRGVLISRHLDLQSKEENENQDYEVFDCQIICRL